MKKILLFVISGILILAIPLTVYIVGKNQEIRKKAAPATTLSLVPAQATKLVGETFPVEIKIDTGENQVATIQIKLSFDPGKLQAVTITNGSMAPTIRASGRVDESGRASITVGAQDASHPITGVGTVAVLTMRTLAVSQTPTSIQFAAVPDTFVNALGEGENNVLIGTTPASITIMSENGSAANSTSLTGNNTNASNSAVISLTPTPSPTPVSVPGGSQSLEITSPANNENLSITQPMFSGTASPGASITITIHSTPITTVVTADASGRWTYTPTSPLDTGQHTVTVLTTDPTTGSSETKTASFIVAAGTETTDSSTQGTSGATESSEPATGSSIPATGAVETTYLILLLGIGMMTCGAGLAYITKRP